MKRSILFLIIYYLCIITNAQDKLNIKLGKITPADFEINSPMIDSNTNAIVLADICKTEFEGNNKEWFSLVFTRHKRINILNFNGFDAANISIYLYSQNSDVEKIEDIKTQTYDLENNNGLAWSLTKEKQKQVNFYADSLKENNTTTVLFSIDKLG